MGAESKKTVSRCTTEKVMGTHVFEIVGYSLKKGIGVGRFVRSATFTIGGYDWSIRFYPDGHNEKHKEYLGIDIELLSSNAEVRALYDLGFVNQATGSLRRYCQKEPKMFNSMEVGHILGRAKAPRLAMELPGAKFIQDDRLVIECTITVLRESHVRAATGCSEIKVPPSNITEHLCGLLEGKEEADVTFSVGGETFKAHRILLAMRSPVFKAELYGMMRETRMPCVTIQNIQPAVFRALLYFIYTDSLPHLGDLDGDDNREMIRHLLVAADKYAIDRLKLICQSILGKNLDVESMATTLALADQHNCDRLKDVCVDFIASSDKIAAVVATKGFADLKRTCPSVFVDLFEKTSRSRKS